MQVWFKYLQLLKVFILKSIMHSKIYSKWFDGFGKTRVLIERSWNFKYPQRIIKKSRS